LPASARAFAFAFSATVAAAAVASAARVVGQFAALAKEKSDSAASDLVELAWAAAKLAWELGLVGFPASVQLWEYLAWSFWWECPIQLESLAVSPSHHSFPECALAREALEQEEWLSKPQISFQALRLTTKYCVLL